MACLPAHLPANGLSAATKPPTQPPDAANHAQPRGDSRAGPNGGQGRKAAGSGRERPLPP
jgi:hypothetical protein